MKIKSFLVFLPVLAFLITGCGAKNEVMMNELAEDGKYHYQNKDLGFGIDLSSDFIYYQTQRKDAENFIDLEFFVPTNDTEIIKEVPSYAKPIVIRVFDKSFWDENKSDEYKNVFEKLEENNEKVYAIKFWENIPSDWQDKWSEELENTLINNFSIIK